MDYNKLIQPAFAGGLILITILVMVVPIPAANMDVFKMCLTAIISFISGSVVAIAAMQHTNKEDKKDEKTVTDTPAAP